MNQTTIGGYLGADPEVRFTSSGQKVTTLNVGTRARKDETIWWRVTLWGDQFDQMMPYLKKGSAIMCTGELNKPEIFTDREGKPRVSCSLTAWHLGFSPFGKSSGTSNQEPAAHVNAAMMSETLVGGAAAGNVAFSDDEIPF
jgi:single-strand DNA-binding protein